MKWLRGIFHKEEGIENDTRDFTAKILDIQRRIEEQRARLGYTQTRSEPARYNEQIPQKTPSVDQAREAKNAELNDLKAKLLGKRK